MSNIPISSLPLAITLDGSESVPIVQGGTTKRTTISNLRSNAPILASAVLFTQGGTGAVQVTLDSLLRKTVVTPEMFGAVGDGVTDDAPALRAAMAYIASLPLGGLLHLSPRVYLLNSILPGHLGILPPYSNLTIDGFGESSVLKVADGFNLVADWAVLYPPDDSATYTYNNLHYRNFKIDLNGANNLGFFRQNVALAARFGTNITVDRVTFVNSPGSQGISLSPPVATPGVLDTVSITNCVFSNMGDVVNPLCTDHSSIYVSAANMVVTGNIFTQPTQSLFSCAIELHGGNQTVESNAISLYARGFNVAAEIGIPVSVVSVAGNVVTSALNGLVLFAGNVANTDVSIVGNVWRRSLQPVGSGVSFIDLGVFVTQDSLNILFADNIISSDVAAGTAATDPVITVGRGTTVIDGNTIVGGCGPGIGDNGATWSAATAVTIRNNLIQDCGTTSVAGSRRGVLINNTAAIENFILEGNTVINTSTAYMTTGFDITLPNAVSGTIKLNNVTVNVANQITFSLSGAFNTAPFNGLMYSRGLGFTPTATAPLTDGQIVVGQTSNVPLPKTLSGDATLSAAGALTLATVNANVGTFGDATHVPQVTYDGKGRATAVSNVAITGTAPGGAAGGDLTGTYPNPTLAAVATAGTTGSSTAIPVITIDAKGRTTGITTAAVIAPAGTLTGATLAANVLASSLTSVGTLTGGGTGAGFTLNFGTSTLTGTIPNANLANSSITINGTAISLGASGTVAAAAGTLTGATLASNVLASSLTSVGTLTGGATGAGFTVALGTSTITGTLSLTNGGLAAALTASNGGIFYSTASAGAILAGTATARQMLQSGATAAPAWSTATWPATTAVSQLLYSSSANTVAGLATANSSVLVTDSGGVPSLATTLPNINIGTPTGGVATNITGLPVSGGLLGTIKPEGRLTLVSATPVMSSTVTAQTTVYYTPDVGTNVPIYNGTAFVPTAFAEVSQATTDATKSPAAVANNSNYDLFCWIDSGTNRCTRGPAWTGDNARGTGAGTSELQRVNGILTNKVAITNGPAANRGTYVGTIRSNGTATIDFQFGALASGGTAGSFGVWNMYNRVTVASMSQDTTDSYNVSAIGIANGSAGMRTSFVVGQIEDGFSSNYNVTAVAGGSGAAQAGVSLNSTTAFSGSIGYLSAATTGNMAGFLNALPLLGFNYTSAMEGVSAGTSAFKGDNGDPTHIQNGHAFMSRL